MIIIELLKSLLYGIVEGITEWLPVSSTGHLILLGEWIPLQVSDSFGEMFDVVIQLGAILAVIVLFFHKLNPFSQKKSSLEKKSTWGLWFRVLVAVIPSGIVGILLDDWLDATLYNYITVAVALIVYGVVFLLIEHFKPEGSARVTDARQLTYRTAFLIGIFQVLALIPGTSRSGSTIIGAMLLGLSRAAAAEFSFFMAIPTMAGASLVKVAKFVGDGMTMAPQEWAILAVGCVSAFVVSLISIRFLMDFVKKHSFAPFGLYRIALGAVVLLYFWLMGR
ncbi:MAG: undecaprenyl-diphosphate phosphatase [Clostridia bacterium]|nr:undecaprenyl-diphosphate phosphatase [Clostridia bacterium]MBQ1981740.1 undecaprenyl-diphosphate phosphatase [Clostridia bacterium]